jgi:hypothetical protein
MNVLRPSALLLLLHAIPYTSSAFKFLASFIVIVNPIMHFFSFAHLYIHLTLLFFHILSCICCHRYQPSSHRELLFVRFIPSVSLYIHFTYRDILCDFATAMNAFTSVRSYNLRLRVASLPPSTPNSSLQIIIKHPTHSLPSLYPFCILISLLYAQCYRRSLTVVELSTTHTLSFTYIHTVSLSLSLSPSPTPSLPTSQCFHISLCPCVDRESIDRNYLVVVPHQCTFFFLPRPLPYPYPYPCPALYFLFFVLYFSFVCVYIHGVVSFCTRLKPWGFCFFPIVFVFLFC